MEEHHYLIRGGIAGRERLRLLARVMRPASLALLERAGVTAGLRCLDVGCGGGDVTFDLASLVGITGHVVGVDLDATKVELARGDATAAPREIATSQVVEHGLRHMAWLAQDDPVVAAELPAGWRILLADYVPEPFRNLG